MEFFAKITINESVVKDYNEAHETNLTVEEYIKQEVCWIQPSGLELDILGETDISDSVLLELPDKSVLKAKAVDDDNFPAINIHHIKDGIENIVAFVEYNPEREYGADICIGAYGSGKDDTIYYDGYSSLEERALMQAKKYIDDYCRKTFEREDGGNYVNLSMVGLAYTHSEDGEHEIQVLADLEKCRLLTVVDDVIIREECFENLNEMNEKALSCLDFDVLVELSESDLRKAAE